MLKHRLSFGLLFIVLVAVLAWFDQWVDGLAAPAFIERESWPPGMVVFVTLAVLGAMGARELARILRAKGVEIGTGMAIFVQLMGFCAVSFVPEDSLGTAGLAAGFTTVAIAYVTGVLYAVRDRRAEGAIATSSGVLMIHVYLGLMLGFLLLIRREQSVWVLIWVLASVKSCDIGAYFTGRLIGRHKLIPWLSPGKTWEGLGGGMLISGLVALLGAWLLHRAGIAAPTLGLAALMGVLMGGVGQAGDLIASLFKRDAGRKDSGSSLPGFGGALDLIDSPILVAPLAYWMLQLTQDLSVGATGGVS